MRDCQPRPITKITLTDLPRQLIQHNRRYLKRKLSTTIIKLDCKNTNELNYLGYSILLFFLDFIVQHSKMKKKRVSGAGFASRIQVKIPILLGPAEEGNPSLHTSPTANREVEQRYGLGIT